MRSAARREWPALLALVASLIALAMLSMPQFADAGERSQDAVRRSQEIAEQLADMTRGNVEAIAEAGRLAAEGARSLSRDVIAKGREGVEETAEAIRTLAEAKSPTEFVQLQGEFARASFDRMVAQSSRFTESFVKLAGEAIQPLSNRATANAERVNSFTRYYLAMLGLIDYELCPAVPPELILIGTGLGFTMLTLLIAVQQAVERTLLDPVDQVGLGGPALGSGGADQLQSGLTDLAGQQLVDQRHLRRGFRLGRVMHGAADIVRGGAGSSVTSSGRRGRSTSRRRLRPSRCCRRRPTASVGRRRRRGVRPRGGGRG